MSELKPLPPEEALAFFRAKGYRESFAWQDVWQEEHNRAFVVAKGLRLDIVADIREAVDRALADGTTFADFQRRLRPTLERKGWWGKVPMTDPLTGETGMVQAGSPRRLRTIFDANIRTAYAAGDWAKIQRVKDRRPYLLYEAVADQRTRPAHRNWSGLVLLADDPFWSTHYPPNGWHCRCRVRQLGPRDLDRYGLKLGTAPEIDTVAWRNPRTGQMVHVPVGIDPGWGYNVGAEHMRSLAPPPATGPLTVHAINPPADLPMPPPQKVSADRMLPGVKSPDALTEEGYLRRFLGEFGASPEKPVVFRDRLDDPVVISQEMFRQTRGDLKVTKRDRERTLLLLADTLKDPDEIWWVWEQSERTGRWFLARRYLGRYELTENGKTVQAILAFSIGVDGWNGNTAYSPSGNNLMNQRRGVLAYRRPSAKK